MTQEEIKKVKNDYKKGLKYEELQKKYNITKPQLIYLIQRNKWKRKSNRSKVLKNNKNAVGNKGGHGPGTDNKNAVTTGQYETLFFDILSDDEKEFIKKIKVEDKKEILVQELKQLLLREYKILKRIKKIEDSNKDMLIDSISKSQYTRDIDKSNTETYTQAVNVINPLQKFDDALIRVQETKRRCINSLHKIENDNRKLELEIIKLEMEAAKESESPNKESMTDDSFIKALEDNTESVWEDYEEQ